MGVTASSDWTLTLEFADGAEPWASLNATSGSGSRNNVILTFEANNGEASRSLDVVLTSANQRASATFTQLAEGEQPTEDPDYPGLVSDAPRQWMELPEMTIESGCAWVFHNMTIDGKEVRNYSLYYDVENRLSHWVAYPLNRGLIGSGGRTDEWGYDPKVPAKYQPVLFRGYDGGYDRGHQLPSADRYGSGINETTFYFTNMTPQLGSLNQKKWADLETQIRNWSYSLDTLYVVTGADIRGAKDVAYDNNGAACTVPEGYFKALLGFKKGSSIGTGGYVGIAFYFEHRSYNNDIMNQSMTIDELENRLGYDFFVNLPRKIGEEWAAKVESDVDDWWY